MTTQTGKEVPAASGTARCPHLIFRDVLGAGTVAALLDYVISREKDFQPAMVTTHASPEGEIAYDLRDCMFLRDMSVFEAPLRDFVCRNAAAAVAQLRLNEPAAEPKEFEIACYRDGSHFGAHVDTENKTSRVRVLSCVYYFAATPRRFSGGELRLYGFPDLANAKTGEWPIVDVTPETDTLVAFPSWLRHEVLPVRVPSRAWADGRFSINCWLHRSAPPGSSPRA
jgi:Rps23 Pro-64 3,4-dihydroxylase Tpa1-like proline 4-hydroxylase